MSPPNLCNVCNNRAWFGTKSAHCFLTSYNCSLLFSFLTPQLKFSRCFDLHVCLIVYTIFILIFACSLLLLKQYFSRSHGHFEIKIYQKLCLPIDACLEVPVKKYTKGPKNDVYSPHIGGSDASKVQAIPERKKRCKQSTYNGRTRRQ